jgi:hypothetical protein
VISFGNLYRKYDEVPRAVCRSDGTVPKCRREQKLLVVIREAFAKYERRWVRNLAMTGERSRASASWIGGSCVSFRAWQRRPPDHQWSSWTREVP